MRKRILVCAICALLLAGASLAGMQGKAVDARRTAPVVQTYPEPAAGGSTGPATWSGRERSRAGWSRRSRRTPSPHR